MHTCYEYKYQWPHPASYAHMTDSDAPRRLTYIMLAICAVSIIVFLVWPDKQAPEQTPGHKPATITKPAARSAAIHTHALPGATVADDTLRPLGDSIKEYVEAHSPGSSVYVEDLQRAVAVHVGETRAYSIKSLMKVPLVMSLHKAEEQQRLDPDIKYPLKKEHLDKDFGDLWRKGAGYELTLHEAAILALQQSDNTAIRFINAHVFQVMKPEERAYKALKLDLKVNADGESFVTTESYAVVMRCLYTSCYNTKHHSEEMLDVLSRTPYKAPQRLLPAGMKVSHKFGNVDRSGFNDCGIVYGPKRPFIYCIMLARGEPQASDDIANIVRIAYDGLER